MNASSPDLQAHLRSGGIIESTTTGKRYKIDPGHELGILFERVKNPNTNVVQWLTFNANLAWGGDEYRLIQKKARE